MLLVSMWEAVADTGPLLALGVIDKLNLLVRLYSRIYVSAGVKKELERGATKYYDARNVLKAVNEGWLKEVSVKRPFIKRVKELIIGPPKLGEAQAESIVLCKQLEIDLLLVDDEDAIRVAQKEGIRTVHGLDILINAVRRGLLSLPEALDCIDKFRQVGEYGEEDLREAEERIKHVSSRK